MVDLRDRGPEEPGFPQERGVPLDTNTESNRGKDGVSNEAQMAQPRLPELEVLQTVSLDGLDGEKKKVDLTPQINDLMKLQADKERLSRIISGQGGAADLERLLIENKENKQNQNPQ